MNIEDHQYIVKSIARSDWELIDRKAGLEDD
jgi:hypothetical protein